jgi:hypothetical protein
MHDSCMQTLKILYDEKDINVSSEFCEGSSNVCMYVMQSRFCVVAKSADESPMGFTSRSIIKC